MRSGHAFVSDFGLAKLAENADGGMTGSAAMLGTPHYMAPEIAAHGLRAATTATDVWSLGVVLHELLAQARPFQSESVPALMREIAEREPEALAQNVPLDLRVIASKALAKDPVRRYATARALADDLRCWLEGRPITGAAHPGCGEALAVGEAESGHGGDVRAARAVGHLRGGLAAASLRAHE
jgi:serine/threonine protein kinase